MIRLFTTAYREPSRERSAEYGECLARNLSCAAIGQVCVLAECEGVVLASDPKLRVRPIPRRPLYDDYFRWINELAAPEDVSVIANADIWFDGGISAGADALRQEECYALARWDGGLVNDRNDAQDCWLFRGPVREVRGDFPVGVPRCDNRILYELQAAGYRVRNPAFSVKAHHLHAGVRTEYQGENLPHFASPPYRYLWPHNLHGVWRTMWFNLTHSDQKVGYRPDWRAIRSALPLRAIRKIWTFPRATVRAGQPRTSR